MSVDTHTLVFTGSGSLTTLVNILVTVFSLQTRGTGAGPLSCHLVSVAARAFLTRVDEALIVQVTEETCLARRTLTLVLPDLVNAGSSVQTWLDSAVVLVHLAVLTSVAWEIFQLVNEQKYLIQARLTIDTDAFVSSVSVSAGSVVLTGIVHLALVNIVQAVVSSPVSRARARVRVHSVHARASVLTHVVDTIIDVDLAVLASES